MPSDDPKRTRTVRVCTYNIHKARGLDGRTRLERIAAVLAGIDADIVALQEVIGASPLKPGQAAELGAALGMGWVMAPTRHLRTALFGNVVLSRYPVRQHVQYDLTWKTCEHRGVQRVDLAFEDDTLHFYNVHLGTSLLERRHQAVKLAAHVHDKRVVGPKIVLGDFNEWARHLGATDVLAQKLQSIDIGKHLSGRRRTYPGIFPLLHLDHIYYEGKVEVLKVSLPRDRMALMASDHLPLVADLKIGFD